MKITTFVITIPRLHDRLNDEFWNSYSNSVFVNPKQFDGVDGILADNDERWQKWKALPYDCCIQDHYDERVVWALIQGYINLYKHIVDAKIDHPILIIEDDSIIVDCFNVQFDDMLYDFIHFMPDDWQVGYIGGTAHNMEKEKRINEYVYKSMGTMRTTAILYKDYNACKIFMDSFINMDEKRPIDVQVLRTIGRDMVKCYRSATKLIYQRQYYSSAMKEGVNIPTGGNPNWV